MNQIIKSLIDFMNPDLHITPESVSKRTCVNNRTPNYRSIKYSTFL